MSSSKGSKRISVFDRLGPGNDESSSSHRRYSSDKHASSSTQEKGRSHAYSSTVPSPHVRMEERETPPTRDRKSRGKHEGSEDEGSRRSSRGKDKGHSSGGGSGDRASSGGGHHRSSPPPPDSASKSRSRREGGVEHKRRKEEEPKTPSELGHKRKRDHSEDAQLPDVKRARHADHHGSSGSGREGDRHKDSGDHGYSSGDKKWRPESTGSESRRHRSRSPRTPVPPGVGSGDSRGKTSSSKYKYSSSSRDGRESAREGSRTRTQDKDRSEGSGRSRALDWAALNSFTERAHSKLHYESPAGVLKRFTPAAVFAGIQVSPDLAGQDKYQQILELVRTHYQDNGPKHCHSYWTDVLEEEEAESADLVSPLKSGEVDWEKVIAPSLGTCRRSLTAADDYTLRRLLRKDQQRRFMDPGRPAPPTWASGHYEVALEYYQVLPNKSSGKPTHRIQSSKVGTLVL